MGESVRTDKTIHEYLLGRVSDEATLEGIEELLFTDEDFCAQVALAEDGIINDYVLGNLNDADADSFRTSLAGNSERQFKLKLTQEIRKKALVVPLGKVVEEKPSFLASLAAWFHQPKYVGAFAVLLIAVVAFAVYFTRKSNTDDLAELRSIYKQGRPTDARISQFDYAPLPQLRGAPEPAEQRRLRRLENNFIEATENNPSAQTYHALGVFHVTQTKYKEAISDLQNALKFAPNDARIRNDLGVAHFELSKTGPAEKKLEELAQSLEEFTKATSLDPNFLEALFNRSLALEAQGLPREARDSWTLYLQKDSASAWADEARKHLERLKIGQTIFKTNEEVLADFFAAYRNGDHSLAHKIHDETKGILGNASVSLQLTRQYLQAQQSGNAAAAREHLEALTYLGNFEKQQYGDSFFFQLANYYANRRPDQTERLLQAKELLISGEQSTDFSDRISKFEKSRELFKLLGNEAEAGIAELRVGQLLPDLGRIEESRLRLKTLIEKAETRQFKIFLAAANYSLGVGEYREKKFSESGRSLRSALSLAEAQNNVFEIQHAWDALTVNYALLGELEPAITYASKMIGDKNRYYQNSNQYWRNRGTLALLTLKLKLFATSLSFSKERLHMIQEVPSFASRANDTLRQVIQTSIGLGDYAGGLRYADQSLQIVLGRPESAENSRATAEILRLRGDLKRRTSDCSSALQDFDKALDLYGRLPQLTSSLYDIHKGRMLCFQDLGRQLEFSQELQTVLDLSEEYRSRIREDSSRQAYFDAEQEVFDAATANALSNQDSRAAFGFVENSRARSLLDFVGSDRSIADAEKTLGAVARPLSLPEIQDRMPEQVQMVRYAVMPKSLAIWTLSKTHFDVVERQIQADELERKIIWYQGLIVGKGPPAAINQAGRELHELLIPPNLIDGKQVCIVADKTLHQLAFPTLINKTGTYLLEQYPLFYAPSASIMVLAAENARRKQQTTKESMLAVGNPNFDREDNPNLGELHDAAIEAKTIASGYDKPLTLIADEATKERFLQNLAGFEVVHFAGHYVANPQSPVNSKLLFTGGDVRFAELSRYKLPKAKLVVLSACETGFDRFNMSEGAIGVARTFLALGAPLVVASQWKVDSETTKDLMIAFHRDRKERLMSSTEALRQAQLEVLRNEKTSAPFYWGAFSLFGGYANY